MPDYVKMEHRLDESTSIPLRLLSQARISSKLTDVVVDCGPYAMLEDAEAKVILDVLLIIANSLAGPPTRGTIRVYDQYHNHDPERIISAHFNNGYYRSGKQANSDQIISNSMELVRSVLSGTAEPEELRPSGHPTGRFPQDSGIYLPLCRDGFTFLMVNTTYGRFYIHVRCNASHYVSDAEDMMWGIAQTLACLRTQDTGLQKSLQKARETMKGTTNVSPLTAMDVVQEIFQANELPSLREWRNITNLSTVIDGKSRLYFEAILG